MIERRRANPLFMPDENKQLVRRYIETVVNTGETAHIADFIAPDYVVVFRGQGYPPGIEGARQPCVGRWTAWTLWPWNCAIAGGSGCCNTFVTPNGSI